MRLSPSKLQAALDALASANARASAAREKVMQHCIAVYGVEPGDIDNDDFIDRVDGGCGAPAGMTAEEFDRSMREAMEQAGLEMPASK